MTTWAWSDTEDRAICQVLHRDDGKFMGYVVRYYWTMTRRIGACSSDQAARGAVERALEQEVDSRGPPGTP
jgi:hypothetical protein